MEKESVIVLKLKCEMHTERRDLNTTFHFTPKSQPACEKFQLGDLSLFSSQGTYACTIHSHLE